MQTKPPILRDRTLKRIHVIFKTHLDVGFTDLAANVAATYFDRYIPTALDLAQALRREGNQNRFIWTTGSWLIYEYLERASNPNRDRLEKAIVDGDIAWHGLPFTVYSELMDVDLFRFGLSLSQELDRRYGKVTIAAKATDVPGHTLGIVPLMAEAGIQFLHIGVNPASTPPDVPPVFVWRSPQGADLVVMYQKGSYGDLRIVPGMEDAIFFAHTGDNLGPQPLEQILEVFHKLRRRFPDVEIIGSTLDAFASKLASIKEDLPLITQELGDTWIHGVGTDPKKISQFRELLRLRSGWLENHRLDPQSSSFKAFSRFLLMVPEHTWGLDIKTHLNDDQAYDAAAFKAARGQAHFRLLERSWEEQRAYLRAAIQALEAPFAAEARQALEMTAAVQPDLSQFEAMPDPSMTFQAAFFSVRFNPLNGTIIYLKDRLSKRNWAARKHPLGSLHYETFSQADYDRFYRQYIIAKGEDISWAVLDYTKPGIEAAGARHNDWLPRLIQIYRRSTDRADQFILRLESPDTAWQEFGCPRTFYLRVEFSRVEPAIEFDLQWFHKQAARLPEAIWFSFAPLISRMGEWKLIKLGQAIMPENVIRNGNRSLHAVTPGVVYRDEKGGLSIDTLDAPLVAPGQPSLLNFNNRQPHKDHGIHFLLYNNIWGTNFPMWYEEDARFRFILRSLPIRPTL